MTKPFKLTGDNYHSRKARSLYLSSSDVKAAMRCEARWYADYCGKIKRNEDKSAFLYGHLFEACLTLTMEQFTVWLNAHPEVLCKSGPRRGQIRSELLPAIENAQAVKRSPYLRGIIKRSKKQVILTGELFGLPMRVMMDLMDKDGSIYDIKSARDFKPMWDDDAEMRVNWWAYWNYPMQLWCYREIARQNGFTVPNVGLIAASKSDNDVQAVTFGKDVMNAAEANVSYIVLRMRDILRGEIEPEQCGHCDWCIRHKKILTFEEV